MKISAKPSRNHGRGLTLIELTVVILVLLALVAVLFIGGRSWKQGADRSGCIMNLRNIQQALRSHQNLSGKATGATINIPVDLVGADNFLQTTPQCPGAGTYSFASVIPDLGTLAAQCSLATTRGHVPASYSGW